MGPGELDALIGDIRREAARRRAAPDFPLDEEALLSVEMDQQGPAGPGGADLAALVAALRALAAQGAAGGTGEVAGLAAAALTALSVRLSQLERRAGAPTGTGGALDQAAPDVVTIWLDALAEHAASSATAPGPILVAGPGAGAWVESLAGYDAYGVDPAGEPFGDRAAVRTGSLLEHLATVGDGALALAVVTGPLEATEATRLDEIAEQLARTSVGPVAVCAESPWAWRRRVGEAAADTSPTRPVGPEAWLAALSRAGFAATGRYDGDGRTFLVMAGRAGEKAGE